MKDAVPGSALMQTGPAPRVGSTIIKQFDPAVRPGKEQSLPSEALESHDSRGLASIVIDEEDEEVVPLLVQKAATSSKSAKQKTKELKQSKTKEHQLVQKKKQLFQQTAARTAEKDVENNASLEELAAAAPAPASSSEKPAFQSRKIMAPHPEANGTELRSTETMEKMSVPVKTNPLEHKAPNAVAKERRDQLELEVEEMPAEVETNPPKQNASKADAKVAKTPLAVETKPLEHKTSDTPAKDGKLHARQDQLEPEVQDMILAVSAKPNENKVDDSLGITFRSILQQAWIQARRHPSATKYGLMLVVVMLVLRILAYRGGTSCRRDKDRSHKQPVASTSKVPSQQVGSSQPTFGLSGNGNAGGPHLCPDLLVPEGSECTLLVPQLNVDGGSRVCISDAKGRPVLRATLGLSPVLRGCRASRLADIQRLVLSSATGDATFAYCRHGESQPGGGRNGLVMYHNSEAPFGVLKPDSCEVGSGYSLIANAGWHIYFRFDRENGNVSAIDECGKLVAVAQPTTKSTHAIRIGSQVDAGMIVLAVLGIGVLEGRAALSRSARR